MSENEVWDEVFRRLSASLNKFLKDNPDKYDAWLQGFRDCAGIVLEELKKIKDNMDEFNKKYASH